MLSDIQPWPPVSGMSETADSDPSRAARLTMSERFSRFWRNSVNGIGRKGYGRSGSHIFIVPNRFGLYAGFLVLAGFAMGYKVQNNFTCWA